MRRAAVLLALLAVAAVAAPGAAAKTTKNFTFQSHNTAIGPGSYEDFPFTIKPDERNGAATIGILWDNPANDWDLYVYKKVGSTLEQVGSSAGGAPQNSEEATVQSQGAPLDPGQYVIRVENFAALDPGFRGTAKFSTFIPPNKLPTARLRAPKRTRAGRKVTLNARKSKDRDGKIVSYAWDLDGNGSMETKTGKRGKIRRRLKTGRRHVAVRVIDDDGAKAFATRTILVYPRK